MTEFPCGLNHSDHPSSLPSCYGNHAYFASGGGATPPTTVKSEGPFQWQHLISSLLA